MKLAQRLLLGSLLIIAALVVPLVALVARRLETRLVHEMQDALRREATLVAVQWREGLDADSLADAAGAALSARVTLIDPRGIVLGDSDFDGPELARLQNHLTRPEVAQAIRHGAGTARRRSPSAGDDEMYVAVRAPLGISRVSIATRTVDDVVSRTRGDVLLSGVIALIVASLAAILFARTVSRPIVALRDIATRQAAGDIGRRAQTDAPGEVGELAAALNRMADDTAARFLALEADDALLSALIESLNEGVIAIDAAANVVRINESGRRLLGLDRPVPMPIDYLPRDRALREAVRAALVGKPTDPTEIGYAGRTLAVTARPLFGGGAVLALFDLTPLRKLETIRRDFVANASHELKTPLTIIVGFAETLATDDPPAAQRRQFAEAIRVHAHRMQRLVDDLLDLSRLESGGWTPSPVWVDVRSAADEALMPRREDARRRGVNLTIDIPPELQRVFADPLALRQLLDNLLDNSMRHTERGEIAVLARAVEGGIEIGVRDTGSGIPTHHLGRVFERFYRADPARSREAGGTGLGLSIVKHLVEAHGGRVRAESTVGHGTTVIALFPTPEGRGS